MNLKNMLNILFPIRNSHVDLQVSFQNDNFHELSLFELDPKAITHTFVCTEIVFHLKLLNMKRKR